MHDVGDVAVAEHPGHRLGVAQVGDVEPVGLDRRRVALAQVVEHEGLDPLAPEGAEAGASDVAGAAGQQYPHESVAPSDEAGVGLEEAGELVAADAEEEHAVAAAEVEPGVAAEVVDAAGKIVDRQRAEAVDALADRAAVLGAEVGDRLDAEGAADLEDVGAGAAGQHVVAGAADQPVVAVAAVEIVVAAAAEQPVVAGLAEDGVVAAAEVVDGR